MSPEIVEQLPTRLVREDRKRRLQDPSEPIQKRRRLTGEPKSDAEFRKEVERALAISLRESVQGEKEDNDVVMEGSCFGKWTDLLSHVNNRG